MNVNDNDILELSLVGNGIKPTNMKASEVAELITAYENALLKVIERDNPEVDLEKVVISLVDIQENSSHYKLLPVFKTVVFAAASTINIALTTNSFEKLPYKTVESLNSIWKFTKKKNCKATFLGRSIPSASINPDNPIEITKEFFFEGETTIYGKVERVGGAEPKVRVRLDNDQVLYLNIDKVKAKSLANRLYESIALKGLAKWRREDFSIEDFTIEEILPFEESKISSSLKDLKGEIGTFWDEIENVDSYILDSRYENDSY